VKGENLQLAGQVDLAHVDVLRDVQHDRCEIEDGGDSGGDQPVSDLLGRRRRRGDHADRDRMPLDEILEVVDG
jgi:hypothetical protein